MSLRRPASLLYVVLRMRFNNARSAWNRSKMPEVEQAFDDAQVALRSAVMILREEGIELPKWGGARKRVSKR